MNEEFRYLLCLGSIHGIGPIYAKKLMAHFGSAEAIFKAKVADLVKVENLSLKLAKSITTFKDFHLPDEQLKFAEKHHIKILSIEDPEYPSKLKNIPDAPIFLFYKGDIGLNKTKIISIVGSRNSTEYGAKCLEELFKELEGIPDLLVVSGLAIGIDSLAHRFACQHKIPNIGVLAHGLDKIYPTQNKALAKQMLENGGLISEFYTGTLPAKENFPIRNRIIAGMSDATIVVETNVKGGSILTAKLALGYNREVLAYPGNIFNSSSKGCNELIKNNYASCMTCAQDLIDLLRWEVNDQKKVVQKQLFIELSTEEKKIVDLIHKHTSIHIDNISLATQYSPSVLAGHLLNLELKGVIKSLPGKQYNLC